MAKREQNTTGTAGRTTPTDTGSATTADAFEEQVVAFAVQLGRIAGSVQASAEGWLDREALRRQIAGVRDSATELLKHLAAGARKGAKKAPGGAKGRGRQKGRSGGVVDAPGKKHRKPLSTRVQETLVKSQADKERAAKTKTGVKTSRLQRRG